MSSATCTWYHNFTTTELNPIADTENQEQKWRMRARGVAVGESDKTDGRMKGKTAGVFVWSMKENYRVAIQLLA